MKTIKEAAKEYSEEICGKYVYTGGMEISESFENGAEWALKNQWISVKDALPKLDKDGYSDNVFIHGSGGYVGSAYYADNTFYTWDGADEISGIDYWMEIPEI